MDRFIDNLISVPVDIGDNLERINVFPWTTIHDMSHHNNYYTHVTRQNIIVNNKNDS